MYIPRYNNFKIILPDKIIPHFIQDMYTEILRDADLLKVYPNGARDCIAESLVNFDLPGMHMKLVEQTVADKNHATSITRYWPRGLNNIRVLDDNEMALTFRHIDGFLNYYMLRSAVDYMSDDDAQALEGEVYKEIGDLICQTRLTNNWSIVDVYQQCVFSAIDGNQFAYASAASENTFTVRCKFVEYYTETYYKDKIVKRIEFNHKGGK